jgi:hypothetical protein
MKKQSKAKNSKIAGVFLLILVIFFIFSTGCSEAAIRGGEVAVESGSESGITSVVPGIIHEIMTNGIENYNPADSSNAIPVVDETKTVPYNHILSYLLAGDQGYQFNIEITTDGAPVDVLVLDENNYQVYLNSLKNDAFSFSFNGVIYNTVVTKNFQYVLPYQGKYYLVIENVPSLRMAPDDWSKRDVDVQVTVELIR